MPGNLIKINNCDKLEWYVGDSKMEKIIKCLEKYGFKQKRIKKDKVSSN